MAAADFTAVQYQLQRLYRNPKYIADLTYGSDKFYGQLTRRKKITKVSGQADVVPVGFGGAGVPSNVQGTTGVAAPSVGQQFLVTPVQLTNLAQLTSLAVASGNGAAAYGKTLKREIDQAMRKLAFHAAIQVWGDGFPAVGTVVGTITGTTLTLADLSNVADPDFTVYFNVGDVLVFAASRNSGGLRAGTLTVTKVHANAGTIEVNANVNTVASAGDFIFFQNQRNAGATVIGITGVLGWLPATAGTLFSVDQTQDDRLMGIRVASSLSDIESAFIDGIKTAMTFVETESENLSAWMHPATWAILAKALQAKSVIISMEPIKKKARTGEVSFTGYRVATPNGDIEVFTSRLTPKKTIFLLNMSTWELVSWGTNFPSLYAAELGAGPGVFMDPTTGNVSAALGGFPQLECNAPGKNVVITLS